MLVCLGALARPSVAAAQVILPYPKRTLALSGLGTNVRGDIRTVGMGGATVGLADTFIASLDNPAGLGMTVGIGDIHFATTTFQDSHVQSFNEALTTQSYGLAFGFYPWAVSVGYVSPYREQATYALSSTLGHNPKTAELGVVVRELVLSASRVFLHDRLSVGLTLNLAQAQRTIDVPSALGGDQSFASYSAGVTVGAMLQLPKRVLLGASFSSPLHFGAASDETQQKLVVPGFFQSVEVPWRVSLGAGFIPNRYFRADLTIHIFTATERTALIRDEAALVGQRVTVQPHLGAAYVFADYKELKATLFLGAYFESTRIAGTSNRFHGTGGVEARIWIFTVGGGVDVADAYRSFLLSVGVDVFGVMARLRVIPPFGTPPAGKMFPRPWSASDEGLARPLVKSWKQGAGIDPIAAGLGIPKNLEQGFRNANGELELIGAKLAAAIAASNETAEEKEAKAAKEKEAARVQAAALIAAQNAQRLSEEKRVVEEKRVEIEKRNAERKKRAKQEKRARSSAAANRKTER